MTTSKRPKQLANPTRKPPILDKETFPVIARYMRKINPVTKNMPYIIRLFLIDLLNFYLTVNSPASSYS